MKIKELSIESQRKIIKNALYCMNQIKYFNSVDVFLNQHYNDKNKFVDAFSDYLNTAKVASLINDTILNTLNSDINTRLSRNHYQIFKYISDSHLHYSILIDDKALAQELVSKGAKVGEDEIQLAAKYGRSSILEMMLHKNSTVDKDTIVPSSCSAARLFWAPVQQCFGYEVNYPEVQRLLKNRR